MTWMFYTLFLLLFVVIVKTHCNNRVTTGPAEYLWQVTDGEAAHLRELSQVNAMGKIGEGRQIVGIWIEIDAEELMVKQPSDPPIFSGVFVEKEGKTYNVWEVSDIEAFQIAVWNNPGIDQEKYWRVMRRYTQPGLLDWGPRRALGVIHHYGCSSDGALDVRYSTGINA
jgi:hypothetical protein